MNDELGKSNIKLFFYRYKDSPYFQLFFIVFIIIACSNIFFQLVLPQIEGWFSVTNEVVATRQRIDTINQNIRFFTTLEKQTVEDQFEIATTALPFEKDFDSIIAALTDASLQSGVSLEDYTFQVGEIASVSAQKTQNQNILPFVEVTVLVSGDVHGVNLFIREMNRKVPLAEVTEINGDAFSTAITVKFYQKHFPAIVFTDDKPMSNISEQDAELLTEFAGWRHIEEEVINVEVSSESGSFIPLF
ncbi:MAG TPA: hypothetical protein VLF20_05380 [Patescibacteria group bacterium]|nr:hypothetical protein [Patescibacteria group bacterium]